jgi:hypothetical protein
LKRKKNADKTALTQHIMDTNHTFDFSNATILCKNISPARLTYLECFALERMIRAIKELMSANFQPRTRV